MHTSSKKYLSPNYQPRKTPILYTKYIKIVFFTTYTIYFFCTQKYLFELKRFYDLIKKKRNVYIKKNTNKKRVGPQVKADEKNVEKNACTCVHPISLANAVSQKKCIKKMQYDWWSFLFQNLFSQNAKNVPFL